MQTILLLVFLGNFFGIVKSKTDVTVDTCTRMDMSYTVTQGSTTGQTYVETTTNNACVYNIADATTESFDVNFANCGVTYTELDSGRIIEFVIVVQENAAYNLATDPRFKVSCTFATGESTVMDIVVTSSNAPDGTPDKDIPVSVNPVPRMVLYQEFLDPVTNDSVYEEISGNVVQLGQPMMLMIELDQELPDYEILIKRCYVQAEMPTVVGSLDVNDETTYCATYPNIFGNFQYYYHLPNSAGPYSMAKFDAFFPTVPSIDLRTENVTLRYLCRVQVCIRGTGCVHPTCSARKKRESETSSANTTSESSTYTLTSGHKISIVGANDQTNLERPSGITPTEKGDNFLCVDKPEFGAILASLLLILLATCIALCYWCVVARTCCRRNVKTKEHWQDSITASKGSLQILPRFVNLSFGSKTSTNVI